ncbi:MAG: TniQ family protein [Arenimonas sp.]
MMRLVVTPPPLLTESLPGYVLHLTDVNGYPSTKLILSTMRKRKDQSSVGRLEASPLMQVAGLSQQQVTRLSMQYPQKNTRDTVALVGQPISRHQIRLNNPKVCPKCLEENQRCHAFWELSLVSICPKHEVHLLDQCRACRNPIRWHRAKTYQCQCGADLRKQRVKRVTSAEWIALVNTIQSLLYKDSVNYPLPTELIAFKGFSVQQLLAFVGRMSFEIERMENGNSSLRATHELAIHVPEVAKALFNWPVSFQAFLTRRYGEQLKSSEDLPAFRHLFSWVPRLRFRSLTDIESEMKMVAQEVFRFGGQFWSKALMSGRRDRHDTKNDQSQWCSVVDAVKISGSHLLTVRRGIAMGEIPRRFALSSRSKRVELVSLAWAENYAATISLPPTLTLRSAAARIGIPVATLRDLRIKGFFTLPPPHIKRALGFFIHELDGFKNALLMKQCSIDSAKNPRLLNADVFLKSSLCSTEKKVELLEEIIAGRIKIFGNAKKLSNVKIEAKSIASYWRADLWRYKA